MPPAILDSRVVIDNEVHSKIKPAPKYRVLLHNDNHNFPEYVAMCLIEVAQLTEDEAIQVMLTAHSTGVGLVKICDIEPAEFYCEGLKSKGLTSTIEPE